MALAGSLKEFGLADILQLISFQKKTGGLMLKSSRDTVRVLFHEGRIVLAESARRKSEERLGRMLIRKGYTTSDTINRALKEKPEGQKVKLGTLLMQKRIVTKEQIQQVLTDQITDLIVSIFDWTEGRYEFTPGAVPMDREIPIAVDAQGLMMDSLRIFDEWGVFKGKVAQETIFLRTKKPTQGLGKGQLELLELVDGASDVSTVADLHGTDAFDAAKNLVRLLEGGYIVPRQAVAEEPSILDIRPAEIPGLSIILAVVVIIAVALSAAVFVGRTDINLSSVTAAGEVDRLRFDLNVKKYQSGAFPKGISETDPWGSKFIYNSTETGFTLFSAGPDRKPRTQDDIY